MSLSYKTTKMFPLTTGLLQSDPSLLYQPPLPPYELYNIGKAMSLHNLNSPGFLSGTPYKPCNTQILLIKQ